MKAKQRLVRFLHEEMGFDVLVCDAPLFDSEILDRALDGSARLDADLMRDFGAFLGATSQSDTTVILPPPTVPQDGALLRLFSATNSTGSAKLRSCSTMSALLARAVIHCTSRAPALETRTISRNYGKQLFQFLDSIDPQLASPAERKSIKSMLDWESRPGVVPNQAEFRSKIPAALAAIDRIYQKLGNMPLNAPNSREILFYHRTLQYLYFWSSVRLNPGVHLDTPKSVLWIAKIWCPKSKIIVWGTNLGAIRNLSRVQTQWSGIAQEFGLDAYSIAIAEITDHTQVGVAAGPSMVPVTDTIEGLLHAAGKPFTFVDFRSLPPDHWLREPWRRDSSEKARSRCGRSISTRFSPGPASPAGPPLTPPSARNLTKPKRV